MATYYMDANGATSGFGILTGTWDNGTTAVWTTNTAGTSATSAVTFTNVDVAQFGRTGTTAIGGTITIAAAAAITVNQIVTQNISTQTIAGGAGATLTPAGTTPTINVGSSLGNTLNVSATIAGAGGFTKSGIGSLNLQGSNTFTGGITLSAGDITVVNTSGLGATTGSAITLGSGTALFFAPASIGGYTYNKSGTAATNNGATIRTITAGSTVTVTFSTLTMGASFTMDAPSANIVMTNAITGGATTQTLTLGGSSTTSVTLSNTASTYVSATTITSGTAKFGLLANVGANSSFGAPALSQATITMGSDGGDAGLESVGASQASSTDRNISFGGGAGTTLTLRSQVLNSSINLTSGGTIVFTGAGTHTLALGGASASTSNIVARIVADGPSGATSLTKYENGTWALSGANTYTGTNTISSGILIANNAAALGSSASSAATTLASASTLRIGNGITLNKSSSVLTSSDGIIDVAASTTGTATFSSIALSGSGNTSIRAGSSGTLTVTNAITGAGTANGITVNSSASTGTVRLSNVNSSYAGTTTVVAGTLEVAKFANVGVASSIGAPALAQSAISLVTASNPATLSHVGTTVDSTDREIILGSTSTVTFSANGTGSGVITYSSGGALTHTVSGNRGITFTGTGSNNNTFARVITDPPTSGATSLTKQGTGRWVLSGENTFTGGTQVTAGELVVGHQNAFQNSTITIGNTGVTLSFGGSLTAATLGGLSAGVLAGINVVVPVGLTLSVGNNNANTTYSNDLTGSGTFNKIGTGTLTLGGGAGASLTCPFSVSAGTLNFGSQDRTLSGGLSISGGTVNTNTVNGLYANTIMTGGTLATVLLGNSTLNVSSGTVKIQPNSTNGSGGHAGNTTVSGTAVLITPTSVVVSTAGNGLVLGQSNTTTVTGTGTIRTKGAGTTATVQRGQARYSSLTLQSGASLEIGYFIS